MKTLHTYLLKEVLLTLVMTVAVFTFILLLGNVLKEILALLVNRQVPFGVVFKAIGLLIPFVLAFALPMGLLTATLLVFGRFSADQELTAARANGISLLALITPILLLALLMCGLCGLVNLQVAPQCRSAYKQMLMLLGLQKPSLLLTEGRFVRDFPGYIIYVGKKRGDEQLEQVIVYTLDPQENEVQLFLRAPHGKSVIDPANKKKIALVLYEAEGSQLVGKVWNPIASQGQVSLELDFSGASVESRPMKLSEMSFQQLLNEYYELKRKGIDPTPVSVQLHRQVAFSFASFGFTLIGIPLGIRAHRRETSIGIALAIVLVLVYYSFIIVAQSCATRPDLQPQFIVWAPNFLFQLVGAFLLWRANSRV
jgi:lipopolysaccharide export system permease protein